MGRDERRQRVKRTAKKKRRNEGACAVCARSIEIEASSSLGLCQETTHKCRRRDWNQNRNAERNRRSHNSLSGRRSTRYLLIYYKFSTMRQRSIVACPSPAGVTGDAVMKYSSPIQGSGPSDWYTQRHPQTPTIEDTDVVCILSPT